MSDTPRRLTFVPIGEIAGSAAPEPDWIWQHYLAPLAITLLAGHPKVGKSTFLFALLGAICGSREFCGKATRPVRIVVLSEERLGTFSEKVRRMAWPTGVDVALRQSTYGMKWEEVVAQAAAHAGPDGLIVVDTLPEFAQLPADAENSAGSVQAALRPLQEAAATGCAVLLIAHQRKAAGEHGEAIRGSNALTAGVDIMLELERRTALGGEARVLKGVSRYGTGLEDLAVVRANDTFEALGAVAEASAGAQLQRVEDELRACGEGTTEALAEAVGLSETTTQRRLLALEAQGRATKSGTGKRGDRYRWRATFDSTAPIPKGRIESADDTGPGGRIDRPVGGLAGLGPTHRPVPGQGARNRPADGGTVPAECPDPPNGLSHRPMLDALRDLGWADLEGSRPDGLGPNV